MADETFVKVKTDALRLLSYRPRSIEELKSRLRLKRHPEEAVNGVIELLQRQGILNDELFAKVVAQSRLSSRPASRRNIEMDLKKKGVSEAVVKKTLAGIKDVDENALALGLAARRHEKMAGLPEAKKKARLYGFLKRRGFSDGTIFHVIDKLMKGADFESGT